MKLESKKTISNGSSVPVAISESSVVKVSADQVSCDLAGEAAILNLATGIYFGLDAVGARVWSLIQEPRTVRDITGVLVEEYEVEGPQCEADLVSLLAEMAAAGLVEIEAGGHA